MYVTLKDTETLYCFLEVYTRATVRTNYFLNKLFNKYQFNITNTKRGWQF